MFRCVSRMAEVSWRVGGGEVVGGYRVLSMARLFALLNGSRRNSLMRVCKRVSKYAKMADEQSTDPAPEAKVNVSVK